MSKRFTETGKWEKPWFHDLPPHLKCLWMYVCDKSDTAGVWEPNWKVASMFIGKQVSVADLKYFDGRLQPLPDGKFYVVPFIGFQYGKLSRDCRPHLKIFESLSKHGLEYTPDQDVVLRTRVGHVSEAKRRVIYERDGHQCVYCGSEDALEPDHIIARSRGGSDAITNLVTACHDCNTLKNNKPVEEFLALNPEKERVLEYLQRVSRIPERVQEEDKEEDKVQDKEKEKDRAKGSLEEIKTFCASESIRETDAEWFFHKCEGNGWTNGGKAIKDWRATIRAWKSAGYMPSQKNGGRAATVTIRENIKANIIGGDE